MSQATGGIALIALDRSLSGTVVPKEVCDGELTQADLAAITGSEQIYRHNLVRNGVYTEAIDYTDFPMEQARLYAVMGELRTIMLPSEY